MSASRVMFGLAVLSLGGAIVARSLPARPTADPPMVVGPLATDFGTVSTGPRALAVTIANPADRPRRVIGLAEG
ncbi:MAG TPA: hypothetical protein VFG68_19710 [Fimbriiglobus sp.]|nr:hypothetical protein [Fimbriiglobus sp.]